MKPLLALAALLCAWLPTRGATAQDAPAAGFALGALPYPGKLMTATFENGDVLSYDGVALARSSAQGVPLQTYATFASFGYPSFVLLDRDEHYALLGESSNDQLWRLELPQGLLVPLGALHFNFDAAQLDATTWYVSAATCGSSCGNEIWKLDAVSGALELRARLDGPSGPIALDAAGNLFHASQSPLFPAPSGSTSIVFLFGAQLASGPVLTPAQGFTIASGFDGGGDLAYDALLQRLYLAEDNYGSGLNRVVVVGTGPANSSVVVAGEAGSWISNLELRSAARGPLFAAFQPEDGERLRYNTTDFAQRYERNEVRPLRPSLSLAGAGASGAGTLSIHVDDALPLGVALLVAAPSARLSTSEAPLPLATALPLFSSLPLSSSIVVPGPLGLDASGAGAREFQHQGDLLGHVALQALVIAPDLALLATSSVALL